MKIDKTTQQQGPQRVAKTAAVKPAADASKTERGATDATDKVELSSLKDEVATLKARIKEMPAVDEDKVARVKKAIDSGTYAADSKAVARSILRNHLADEKD